jgi:hypothetical protein
MDRADWSHMARNSTSRKPKAPHKKNLTPLWLALAGLSLILLAAWAVLANAQPETNVKVQGQPRLEVERSLIDRGNVKLGTPIRDDIRITNVGDQPLRFVEDPFVEVKAGC